MKKEDLYKILTVAVLILFLAGMVWFFDLVLERFW